MGKPDYEAQARGGPAAYERYLAGMDASMRSSLDVTTGRAPLRGIRSVTTATVRTLASALTMGVKCGPRSIIQFSCSWPPRITSISPTCSASSRSSASVRCVSATTTSHFPFSAATAARAESMAGAFRDRLKRVEPEIRLGTPRTLVAEEADRTLVQRFTRSLLLIFAALAVLLASLGIYGVVSYTVAQRTREIGIRMALGASRRSVARMVLEQTLGATLLGIAMGAAGASLLQKLLATQLYGITAHDPRIHAAVTGLIAAVSLAASAVPMLRASRVDPASCLREE